jgi:hypothetical protein
MKALEMFLLWEILFAPHMYIRTDQMLQNNGPILAPNRVHRSDKIKAHFRLNVAFDGNKYINENFSSPPPPTLFYHSENYFFVLEKKVRNVFSKPFVV